MILQDIDFLITESFERTKAFVGRNKGKLAIGAAITTGAAIAASKGYLGDRPEIYVNYAKHMVNGADPDKARALVATDYLKNHIQDNMPYKLGDITRELRQRHGFGGRFY